MDQKGLTKAVEGVWSGMNHFVLNHPSCEIVGPFSLAHVDVKSSQCALSPQALGLHPLDVFDGHLQDFGLVEFFAAILTAVRDQAFELV